MPAATDRFGATADWIWWADEGNDSQQSFGNFEGGLEQFWVIFWPQSSCFYWTKWAKKNTI